MPIVDGIPRSPLTISPSAEQTTPEPVAKTRGGYKLAAIANFFTGIKTGIQSIISGRSNRESQDAAPKPASPHNSTNVLTTRELNKALAETLRNNFHGQANDLAKRLEAQGDKDIGTTQRKAIFREADNLSQAYQFKNTIQTMTFTVPGRSDAVYKLAEHSLPMSVVLNDSQEGLHEKIQAKIDNGARIVSDVAAGKIDTSVKPSAKDVADVMWFLQAAAELKIDSSFESGAVTIEDQGGKLRKWLDTCPDAYQRTSSHTEGFQKLPDGVQRGIDMTSKDDTVDTLLPNNRKTVLYGRFAQNNDPSKGPVLKTELLFVKLESHGCKLTGKTFNPDANAPTIPLWKLSREDIKESILHAFSFLQGSAARASGDHGADTRKERIPKEAINAFKQLKEDMPKMLRSPLAAVDLKSDSDGIRMMKAAIDELSAHLDALNTPPANRENESIGETIVDLQGADEQDIVTDDENEIDTGSDMNVEIFGGEEYQWPNLRKQNIIDDTPIGRADNGPLQMVGGSLEDRLQARDLIEKFRTDILGKWEPETLDLRIGNEVILTARDITA